MKTLNKCEKIEELHKPDHLSKVPVLNTHLETHHSVPNLQALVSDIKRYPEFIHWIKALRVSNQHEENGIASQLGEVVVGFKGFTERFSTNVVSNAIERTVTATLVRGPFRRLKNVWKFHPLETGRTRLEFHLDYEFSNPILAMLAKSNTEKAVNKIMESFIAEADKRYGSAAGRPAP